MERPPPDLFDSEVPASYAGAVTRLIDREFLAGRKYGEQQHRAIRRGAHPQMLMFEKGFIRALAKMGIPAFTHECVRDSSRQDDLYALGVTKARGGQSAHNYGCALDIVHSVFAWRLSEREWQVLGHIGREVARTRSIKVVWGGDDPGEDDKFSWDPAHWELKDWKAVKFQYPNWGVMPDERLSKD